MDVFQKCRDFTRASEARDGGYYFMYREIGSPQDPVVTMDGQKVIMLGSNNYLGLTQHPEVVEAAIDALRKYGSGCTGSRFLNGTLDLHLELEAALADFLGKEDCMVFSTGYAANLGLIAGLVSRSDVVYLDKNDHASIVDGAKLAFGSSVRFRHTNLDDLGKKLSQKPAGAGALIIVDGVYSMDGDIADLPGLVALAQQHKAVLAVDDAHALGVLGPRGDGTAAHYGLEDDVEIIAGTFSKSFASVGGFVAADENVVHYLRHHGRPFMFSAALPPASAASVHAALKVLQQEPERREQLWANTERLQAGLRDLGFEVGSSRTPIIPVLVGELEKTFQFWKELFDAGVFTNPVAPPAVSPSSCRLRTSLMATLSFEQIDFCLEIFDRVGRKLQVI